MKLSYLLKATPFLSTLVLIIFLSISNQKEYTKIKILIWSTPSLTLGNYLAISTGTGFILSYLITTKLGKIIQTSQGQVLEFKEEAKYEESPDYKEALKNTNHSYDNTLIERDIKDPSPTIKTSIAILILRQIRKPASIALSSSRSRSAMSTTKKKIRGLSINNKNHKTILAMH